MYLVPYTFTKIEEGNQKIRYPHYSCRRFPSVCVCRGWYYTYFSFLNLCVREKDRFWPNRHPTNPTTTSTTASLKYHINIFVSSRKRGASQYHRQVCFRIIFPIFWERFCLLSIVSLPSAILSRLSTGVCPVHTAMCPSLAWTSSFKYRRLSRGSTPSQLLYSRNQLIVPVSPPGAPTTNGARSRTASMFLPPPPSTVTTFDRSKQPRQPFRCFEGEVEADHR